MNEITQQQDNNLLIEQVDGKAWVSSLVVAEKFEKEHRNVLKAIQTLECTIEFNRLNFEPIEYKDSMGREQPMYRMTRDGFSFLCMGFTGQKAAEWKERFIKEFNRMESLSKPATALDALDLAVKALRDQDRKLKAIETKVDTLETKTDARIKTIESRLVAEKINQFPKDCARRDWIADKYFPGMSPDRVSQWLQLINHPIEAYRYTTDQHTVATVPTFKIEGLREAADRLMKESHFDKETKINKIYIHPSFGRFYIKTTLHHTNIGQ